MNSQSRSIDSQDRGDRLFLQALGVPIMINQTNLNIFSKNILNIFEYITNINHSTCAR